MANHTTNNITEGNTTTFSLNTTNLTYNGKCQKKVKQPDGTYKYYDVLTSQAVNHLYRHKVIFSKSNGTNDRVFLTLYNTSPKSMTTIQEVRNACGDGELSVTGYQNPKLSNANTNFFFSLQFSNDNQIMMWCISHHSLGGDAEWHTDIYRYSDTITVWDYVTKIF